LEKPVPKKQPFAVQSERSPLLSQESLTHSQGLRKNIFPKTLDASKWILFFNTTAKLIVLCAIMWG